jgi:hypothetical protein
LISRPYDVEGAASEAEYEALRAAVKVLETRATDRHVDPESTGQELEVQSDPVLPPRALRRNLSVEAYLNELEVARRWKREHPAEARAHSYVRCDCGNVKHRQASMCAECARVNRAEWKREKRSYIRSCWAMGMTLREIATGLDTTPLSVQTEMLRMRKDGWDLPYRRVPRGSTA